MMSGPNPKTRWTTLLSLLAGAIAGGSLLVAGAPVWAFFLAPLASLPLVVAYLESKREVPSGASALHDAQAGLSPTEMTRTYVDFGEVQPGDPYLALLTPSSVYVFSDPSERERLRTNTVRRLGMKAVVVTETGTLALWKEPPSAPSRIYGTPVLVGSKTPARDNPQAPPTLQGTGKSVVQSPPFTAAGQQSALSA